MSSMDIHVDSDVDKVEITFKSGKTEGNYATVDMTKKEFEEYFTNEGLWKDVSNFIPADAFDYKLKRDLEELDKRVQRVD